mmetsp:Transcript_474/g.1381  ORF Transcript_474/g.1381 Transcript_474/m.1381 type:complete len:204 (+) Transcript_474:4742-5353(+)|eukprot:scaffold459_cov117-Isochrysis_galbana.AAC.11
MRVSASASPRSTGPRETRPARAANAASSTCTADRSETVGPQIASHAEPHRSREAHMRACRAHPTAEAAFNCAAIHANQALSGDSPARISNSASNSKTESGDRLYSQTFAHPVSESHSWRESLHGTHGRRLEQVSADPDSSDSPKLFTSFAAIDVRDVIIRAPTVDVRATTSGAPEMESIHAAYCAAPEGARPRSGACCNQGME